MTGKDFKETRISLGLTQAQLAELLDVKENAVWRWEAEKVKISRILELAVEQVKTIVIQNKINFSK